MNIILYGYDIISDDDVAMIIIWWEVADSILLELFARTIEYASP